MTTAHRDQLAGLNPEEEAEKCRTERRKMNRRQTTAKLGDLIENVQICSCEQRKEEVQPEASAEHTAPFCNGMETRHLWIRVHLDVSKSNQALMQKMYPLSIMQDFSKSEQRKQHHSVEIEILPKASID